MSGRSEISLARNAQKSSSVLGVAADGGSRSNLLALTAWRDFELHPQATLDDEKWLADLQRGRFRMLVVGTSDSVEGAAMEARVRRLAARHGVPIVAVEDFPGNFSPLEGAPTALLVVESIDAATLHQKRWAERCPPLLICPAVRYDSLKAQYRDLRRALVSRREDFGPCPRVLWAGQPESAHCIATLLALAPALGRLEVHLLFKAHPRDAAHRLGTYRTLLEPFGVEVTDITELSVSQSMDHAPDVVLTQFSSLAVEAGFHGVPAILALYPDHGNKLLKRKGYDIPGWCQSGAAFVTTDPAQGDAILRNAIHDKMMRARIISAFDEYFRVDEVSAPSLISRLQAL